MQLQPIEEPANSRTRIMVAAMQLFARHGYEKTSTRMIAKEAGVALGLIYNYFQGKEELLRTIFMQSLADVHASLQPAEKSDSFIHPVEAVVNKTFDLLDEHREFWRMFYLIRWQPQVVQLLQKELDDWKHMLFSPIEQIFTVLGAQDPAAEARVFQALLDGVGQMYIMQLNDYPIERIKKQIIQLYTK